jgi:L-ascorbate metabolism protein UlaG (beta-lactamase superfamily)
MEIEFFGANCFRLKTKETTLVVDDNLDKIGQKSIVNDKTVAFYSQKNLMGDSSQQARVIIDHPGEFEVGDVTVKGIQTRAHIDEQGEQTATVFQFTAAGTTVSVIGHVHPDVSADVLEMIGGTDVLIVPVGGNGYTLDPVGAASLIKKVEADVVIPSQYEITGYHYEMPAQPIDEFTKVMSVTLDDTVDVYKTNSKQGDITSGTAGQTRVVVLKPRQK